MSGHCRALIKYPRGTRKFLQLIATLLMAVMLPRCTVEKRRFTKGYYVQWNKNHHKTARTVKKAQNTERSHARLPDAPLTVTPPVEVYCDAKQGPLYAGTTTPIKLRLPPDSCGDKLLFRNGDELKVKIIEVSDDQLKYQRCDNLEGPVYSSSTETIFSVTYTNGLKRLFSPKAPDQAPAPPKKPKKLNDFALASFLCAIPFFLIVPLVLSFIFGIIALTQIKKAPERYKGKWMAVVGVVLGSIAVIFFLLFLTAILL